MKRYVLRFLRKGARLSQEFNVVGSSFQNVRCSNRESTLAQVQFILGICLEITERCSIMKHMDQRETEHYEASYHGLGCTGHRRCSPKYLKLKMQFRTDKCFSIIEPSYGENLHTRAQLSCRENKLSLRVLGITE